MPNPEPDPEPPLPPGSTSTGGPDSSSGESADDSSSTGTSSILEDIPPWKLPDDCGWLAGEQAYCLLVTSEGTMLHGVDSGLDCELEVPAVTASQLGMGWIGMSTATCKGGFDEGVVRVVRLDTGESIDIETPCNSVSSYEDRLYISSDQLRAYPDYLAAVEGSPSDEFGFATSIFRIAVDDERAWMAWHSTDELETWSLEDGKEGLVLIPEHAAWVHGIAVVNDLILIGTNNGVGDTNGPTLSLYDKASGMLLERRPMPGWVDNLSCRSTAP